MRAIPLSRGMVTLVDDADFGWLSQYRWHARKGRGDDYYAQRGGKDGTRGMHREIMDPDGVVLGRALLVDHLNHNTLDNRRDNLRWSTYSQSNMNRSMRNQFGFKGVFWIISPGVGPYGVAIKINGKRIYGRRQPDIISAAREYNRLALELHGEFASLNILPDDGTC